VVTPRGWRWSIADGRSVLTVNVVGSNNKSLFSFLDLPESAAAVILTKRIDLCIVKNIDQQWTDYGSSLQWSSRCTGKDMVKERKRDQEE